MLIDGVKKGGITFFDYFQFYEDLLKNMNFLKDLNNESFK